MAHLDYPSRPHATDADPLRGHPATLTALLRLRAAEQADDLAFAFLSDGVAIKDRMTYADLDRRAGGVAGLLRAHGVRGEPVLLLYPPGLDYVSAFFGCVFRGA